MNKFIYFFMFFLSFKAWAYPMQELYEKLDITSFNSSLMPMIDSKYEYKNFKDINQLATSITEDEIIIDSEYWKYSLKVIKVKGSDFYVCFSDKAKMGSYDAQSPMVLRKYNDIYMATARRTAVCEEYAR
ncbi:hypothetical protein ACFSJQ_05905 [Vibrio olivae]|uniref:Uncharacterized protein n=1 Tax=Vibrio olivae TaxID=1243002 RepID=A0ABV5HJ71_9VIBR